MAGTNGNGVSSMVKPPTTEIGVIGSNAQMGYLPNWSHFQGSTDDLEINEKLTFPESIHTYHGMRSDAQVQGLLYGSWWPLFRMNWFLDDNGAREDGVTRLAKDLGLPIGEDGAKAGKGENKPRSKHRFKFLEHIQHAVLAMVYGFMPFEQVGEMRDGEFHYRKLGPRMPQSIREMSIAEDGGLEWISQEQGIESKKITIDRLVMYTFQREGANWQGRSILRGCYPAWLMKDRSLRIGTMNLQRAGVGTPIAEAPQGATEAELIALDRMMEKFKAGTDSGGAVPYGTKVRLVGVEGTQPDTAGWIKLMNEEMARAFLMMFMQLGQSQSGSRALGETFVDYHKLTMEFIAQWISSIFTEHIIEDDWDWNYGEDEEFAPLLSWKWDEETDDGAEAAEDPAASLKKRVQKGEVQVDDEVAAALGIDAGSVPILGRSRAGRSGRQSTRAARVASAADASLPLPSRPLRRQPTELEVQAQFDIAATDSQHDSTLDLLQMEMAMTRQTQIAELHDAIVEANGNMKKIAKITATPNAADILSSRFRMVAGLAAFTHEGEAERQGKTTKKKWDVSEIQPRLDARAQGLDETLTHELTTAAQRHAMRLSGGGLSPAEVAADVKAHLEERVDQYAKDVVSGGVQAAINEGRALVMRVYKPPMIVGSEILDTNTCSPCIANDGRQYLSVDDALRDYPAGGYTACKGRERCRGTLIARYDTGTEFTPGTFR